MADAKDLKQKPKIIDLGDGVERECDFTLNAMAELEEKYGSVDACFTKLQENSFTAVRFVLWAMFGADDSVITEKEIGKLLTVKNMGDVLGQMLEVFQEAMPAEEVTAVPNQSRQTSAPKKSK